MKARTMNVVNNKLNLLEKFVKEGNSNECQNIYNNIPSTGWNYFIDEIVSRGLGSIEGAFLRFNFEQVVDFKIVVRILQYNKK